MPCALSAISTLSCAIFLCHLGFEIDDWYKYTMSNNRLTILVRGHRLQCTLQCDIQEIKSVVHKHKVHTWWGKFTCGHAYFLLLSKPGNSTNSRGMAIHVTDYLSIVPICLAGGQGLAFCVSARIAQTMGIIEKNHPKKSKLILRGVPKSVQYWQ